jgi:uncharacterized LabA/DUF88 family protein
MDRVLVVVDIKNLYYSVNKHCNNRRVHYGNLLNKIKNDVGNVTKAVAFGLQTDNQAMPFIDKLRHLGYEVHYKEPRYPGTNWCAGITLEMVKMLERVDTIVLCGTDYDILPTLDYVRSRGVNVIAVGCMVPTAFKRACNRTMEITEELLENATAETAQ